MSVLGLDDEKTKNYPSYQCFVIQLQPYRLYGWNPLSRAGKRYVRTGAELLLVPWRNSLLPPGECADRTGFLAV